MKYGDFHFSPWPDDVWTMDVDGYVKAIPDEKKRCAVSGYLMRCGWIKCRDEFHKIMNRSGLSFDICPTCGELMLIKKDAIFGDCKQCL